MPTLTNMARQERAATTKAAIIEASLSLFAERGFEATTMRAIAERAGVSVGNAYYYFASKEHLIQGFYDQVAQDHAVALPAALAGSTELGERLQRHLLLWLDLMQVHHRFAATFFRNAADPASPLSPFSAESAPARAASAALMHLVIDGSDVKVGKTVRDELPELLWLFHMGVVLFWVHDRSDGAMATRLLVMRTVPMVVRAVELSRLPVLRATVNDLVALVADLKSLMAPAPQPTRD